MRVYWSIDSMPELAGVEAQKRRQIWRRCRRRALLRPGAWVGMVLLYLCVNVGIVAASWASGARGVHWILAPLALIITSAVGLALFGLLYHSGVRRQIRRMLQQGDPDFVLGKPLAVTATLDDEDLRPIHPWRGVIGAWSAVGMVILAMLLVRAWWSGSLDRELSAEIAQWRARGEPVTPADLAMPFVPDEDNAAVTLRAAAGSVRADDPAFEEISDLLWRGTYPWPDEVLHNASQVLREHSEVLAQVRLARAQGQVYWPELFHPNLDPRKWFEVMGLTHQQSLANLLSCAAIHAHLSGDDADAVERIQDGLFQASVMAQQPYIVAYVMATGVEFRHCMTLLRLTPQLRIADDPQTSEQAIRPASRQQVKALIAVLLEEEQRTLHLRRALMGYRALVLESIDAPPRPRTFFHPRRLEWIPASRWESAAMQFYKPVFQKGSLHRVHCLDQVLLAVAERDWPGAMKHTLTGPLPTPTVQLRLVNWHVEQMLRVQLTHVISVQYQCAFQRRAAAVALAIRLYQLDHDGRRPEELADLVPDYLPAVPVDPFASDDRAIGYFPATTQPFVYSVNMDGKDDIAAGTWTPTPQDEAGAIGAADIVYFLDPPPPAPAPAPGPADGDASPRPDQTLE